MMLRKIACIHQSLNNCPHFTQWSSLLCPNIFGRQLKTENDVPSANDTHPIRHTNIPAPRWVRLEPHHIITIR